MPFELIEPARAMFREYLTARDVTQLARNPRLEVLQTDRPATVGTWRLINDEFISVRPDVDIRVYG